MNLQTFEELFFFIFIFYWMIHTSIKSFYQTLIRRTRDRFLLFGIVLDLSAKQRKSEYIFIYILHVYVCARALSKHYKRILVCVFMCACALKKFHPI